MTDAELQDWIEMKKIRTKKYDNSVWIPLYEFTIKWTNNCPRIYGVIRRDDDSDQFDRKNVFVIDFEIGDRVIMKRDDSIVAGSIAHVLEGDLYGILFDGEKTSFKRCLNIVQMAKIRVALAFLAKIADIRRT